LGGMIFSPITPRLIAAYGWRGAMMIYAVFMFAVFAPLVYLFVKNRPAEIGADADPDESDWFLRRQRLFKSIVAVAGIVGALIYSPIPSLLTGRFGKPATVMIFTALGIVCLAGLICYFARKGESAAAAVVAEPSPDPSSGK